MPENTNTYNHAKRELEILLKTAKNPSDLPVIIEFQEEILALCEKFGRSGQSGGSAPFIADALAEAVKKLCLQQTIAPITGLRDEWVNVAETSGGGKPDDMLFQNNRCSALFKNADGRCWYLDAIIWRSKDGTCFSGTATKSDGTEIESRQFIKGFPFIPRTFVIDVMDDEVGPGDWDHHIVDENQLNEVSEYYALPYPDDIDKAETRVIKFDPKE